MFGRGFIFLLLIVGALWFLNKYQNAEAAAKDKMRKLGLLYGGVGLLILLIVTGHANPLFALTAAAVPWIHRAMAAKSVLDALRAGRSGAHADGSRVNTRHLTLYLDPDTGELAALVMQGKHKGRYLDELTLDELIELFNDYRREDPESSTVLATWLDRSAHARTWRSKAGHTDNNGAMSTSMSVAEAADVLGLDVDAHHDDIVLAHRKLMQRVHPDRGGVAWLAAKVNEAKRVMLAHVDS